MIQGINQPAETPRGEHFVPTSLHQDLCGVMCPQQVRLLLKWKNAVNAHFSSAVELSAAVGTGSYLLFKDLIEAAERALLTAHQAFQDYESHRNEHGC